MGSKKNEYESDGQRSLAGHGLGCAPNFVGTSGFAMVQLPHVVRTCEILLCPCGEGLRDPERLVVLRRRFTLFT